MLSAKEMERKPFHFFGKVQTVMHYPLSCTALISLETFKHSFTTLTWRMFKDGCTSICIGFVIVSTRIPKSQKAMVTIKVHGAEAIYSWQRVVHNCLHALLFTLPLKCSSVFKLTIISSESNTVMQTHTFSIHATTQVRDHKDVRFENTRGGSCWSWLPARFNELDKKSLGGNRQWAQSPQLGYCVVRFHGSCDMIIWHRIKQYRVDIQSWQK